MLLLCERTQEVTFDSQLKSHTGEPFNFQATSLNCLCCCSSTFIVRTWLNRAGGAWRARRARGSLQFLATINQSICLRNPQSFDEIFHFLWSLIFEVPKKCKIWSTSKLLNPPPALFCFKFNTTTQYPLQQHY